MSGCSIFFVESSKQQSGIVERDFPILSLREPPALFFDCTHDNEVPPQKFHPSASLCNAALSWMVDCPVGTVRGYDEIVREKIDLVHDTRKYTVNPKDVGMIQARKTFNFLHRYNFFFFFCLLFFLSNTDRNFSKAAPK